MREIFERNVEGYDSCEDPEYFYRADHLRRQEIALELLADVIKSDCRNQPKLLSLACATGMIEERMKNQLELEVFGIDGARHALKTASRRGIHAACAEVSWLPFADQTFDYVYAGEIIEHVFNTHSFLDEINRVIKTEGTVVLTTPNLAKIDDRLKFLIGKTPRQIAHLHPFLYLHIRPFTYDLLRQALEEHGFSKVSLRTNAIRIDLGDKSFITCSQILTKLFPSLGATLIVRAKKTDES